MSTDNQCLAPTQDGEYCRNNQHGETTGCFIRQHKDYHRSQTILRQKQAFEQQQARLRTEFERQLREQEQIEQQRIELENLACEQAQKEQQRLEQEQELRKLEELLQKEKEKIRLEQAQRIQTLFTSSLNSFLETQVVIDQSDHQQLIGDVWESLTMDEKDRWQQVIVSETNLISHQAIHDQCQPLIDAFETQVSAKSLLENIRMFDRKAYGEWDGFAKPKHNHMDSMLNLDIMQYENSLRPGGGSSNPYYWSELHNKAILYRRIVSNHKLIKHLMHVAVAYGDQDGINQKLAPWTQAKQTYDQVLSIAQKIAQNKAIVLIKARITINPHISSKPSPPGGL